MGSVVLASDFFHNRWPENNVGTVELNSEQIWKNEILNKIFYDNLTMNKDSKAALLKSHFGMGVLQ